MSTTAQLIYGHVQQSFIPLYNDSTHLRCVGCVAAGVGLSALSCLMAGGSHGSVTTRMRCNPRVRQMFRQWFLSRAHARGREIEGERRKKKRNGNIFASSARRPLLVSAYRVGHFIVARAHKVSRTKHTRYARNLS